jgi:hypothetical protein
VLSLFSLFDKGVGAFRDLDFEALLGGREIFFQLFERLGKPFLDSFQYTLFSCIRDIGRVEMEVGPSSIVA